MSVRSNSLLSGHAPFRRAPTIVKPSRPSRTAHLVALGRAIADAGLSHVPEFRDPTARVFLSEKGKRSLARTEEAARKGKRSFRLDMARVMAA
jgi:O-methyltransferase involved in polyketide biosynthesis